MRALRVRGRRRVLVGGGRPDHTRTAVPAAAGEAAIGRGRLPCAVGGRPEVRLREQLLEGLMVTEDVIHVDLHRQQPSACRPDACPATECHLCPELCVRAEDLVDREGLEPLVNSRSLELAQKAPHLL